MDLVLLSGFGLLGSIVAAMAGLLHAELREGRPAYRPPNRQTRDARGTGHSYAYGRRSTDQSQEHAYARAREQQARQQRARPAAVRMNPWAPFIVSSDTGRDELRRQYRMLARTCHPDHGGDHNSMAHINKLYAELIATRH